MPEFIVLSRVSAPSRKAKDKGFELHDRFDKEIERIGGKVIDHFALLGGHDFCSIVSLPNNAAAQMLETDYASYGNVDRTILPAIDLPLFMRLCEQTTASSGPHRWQVWRVAQLFRRAVQPFIALNRDARRYFRPFVIDGKESLRALRGPVIFIANHASHLDPSALNKAIPRRYRHRTYIGSAADRWFIQGRRDLSKQGWWRSLAWGMFPIHRGGGSQALDYAGWVIDRGGSIIIYPEGTRTTTGKLGKFKPGPAILALRKDVPVVPVYMDGLRELRPKGQKLAQPGPVHVFVGSPIKFAPGTEVAQATLTMRHVMEALQKECRARHPAGAQ